MPKNLHGSKNRPRVNGLDKTDKAKKRRALRPNRKRRGGGELFIDKGTRQILGKGTTGLDISEDSKNAYHEFHEKDRRDRRGRLKRMQASERREAAEAKKDRPDSMKVPLLEAALKGLEDAQTLQRLFIAASLKFIPKKGHPFFFIKRLHKLGNRPITVLPA